MKTEFEAKFINIDKDEVRARLKAAGARLVVPERLMRRALAGKEFYEGKWLRLRDEGDKVTLTFKNRSGRTVDNTTEIEVEVEDFQSTKQILEMSDIEFIAYQENKRESWVLGKARIEIDTWPGVPAHIEIEAPTEKEVRNTAAKLGFNWSEASFLTADELYAIANNISNKEALIAFENLRFND